MGSNEESLELPNGWVVDRGSAAYLDILFNDNNNAYLYGLMLSAYQLSHDLNLTGHIEQYGDFVSDPDIQVIAAYVIQGYNEANPLQSVMEGFPLLT